MKWHSFSKEIYGDPGVFQSCSLSVMSPLKKGPGTIFYDMILLYFGKEVHTRS